MSSALSSRGSGPLHGWQAFRQMSPVVRLRRSPPPLLCRNACHPRSSSACGQSRAVPKPPGCPLPPALDHACVYGNCHREGLGRCAGGRRLDKCPPSSAFGGRLLLYFVQTPATRAAARLADSQEPQPGPPGCLTRGGRGACVRSKGGGDGRRPAPGDIRTQAPLPPALDQPAFLLDDAKKKRGPDVPEAAPGEKMPWKGQGIRTRS